MTIPSHASHASRLLAQAAPIDVPPPSDEARARAIVAIEAALRQRLRWRLARMGIAAVAAAAAVGFVFLRHADVPKAANSKAPAHTSVLARREPTVVAHFMGQGARIVGGGELLASDGQVLSAGARVIALPAGHVVLSFDSGSKVTLEESAAVRLVELAASDILALERGALLANVAKLGPDRRFVVRTDDAEIEVHGTSFRVATAAPDLACGGGSITRLEVYQGVVSVRANGSEVFVRNGERWPSGCAPAASAPAAPASVQSRRAARTHIETRKPVSKAPEKPSVSDSGSASALRGGASSGTAPALRGGASSGTAPALRGGASSGTAPALRGGASSGTAPALRGGASSGTAPALRGGASSGTAPALRGGASSGTAPALRGGASMLARENDMFARATAARRAGDLPLAISELEAMLASYPQGPLAQDASVKRMELLQQVDPGRALEAARNYLARYPRGFARAEAEALLDTKAPPRSAGADPIKAPR